MFSIHGTGIGGGIVIGRARVLESRRFDVARYHVPGAGIEAEVARLDKALEAVRGELGTIGEQLSDDAPSEARAGEQQVNHAFERFATMVQRLDQHRQVRAGEHDDALSDGQALRNPRRGSTIDVGEHHHPASIVDSREQLARAGERDLRILVRNDVERGELRGQPAENVARAMNERSPQRFVRHDHDPDHGRE